ncbi:MAG: hypothetical protein H6925_06220 [Holosporaceae bacterium]|nr:MAG: hypothetical protein H6925_06220 [Holosporaceae bacterium]
MQSNKIRHIGGVPHQAKPFLVADLLSKQDKEKGSIVFFVNQRADYASFRKTLQSRVPDIPVYSFPEWDTLPYDRVSPSAFVVAERLQCLNALKTHKKMVVITSMAAISMPTIPNKVLEESVLIHTDTSPQGRKEILSFLEKTGYVRVDTVKNCGEFSVRGSLIDIFFVGEESPLRLDFF